MKIGDLVSWQGYLGIIVDKDNNSTDINCYYIVTFIDGDRVLMYEDELDTVE